MILSEAAAFFQRDLLIIHKKTIYCLHCSNTFSAALTHNLFFSLDKFKLNQNKMNERPKMRERINVICLRLTFAGVQLILEQSLIYDLEWNKNKLQ